MKWDNEDTYVVTIAVCLLIGWLLGIWACWGFKPFREYIVERRVFVSDNYPYRKSERKTEEKTTYYINGKEVSWEYYRKQ